MKYGIFLAGIALSLLILKPCHSQDSLSGDRLLIRAMKDEIGRNLNNLQEQDYEKPFFIAYTVSDIRFGFSLSTLGAVINSASTRNRSWNARVIVGDYDINDENFDNTFQGFSHDPGYENLPVDDDYWGVRRVFWIATNNIYKSAARNYAQKVKNLRENELEYPLGDFSKESPVIHYDTTHFPEPDMQKIERMGKEISARFKGHPEIVNSGAYVSTTSAVSFFVNSEGTEVRVPSGIASVYIDGSVLGKASLSRSSGLQYLARTLNDLPSLDSINEDIDILIKNVLDSTEVIELEDDYTGPVLLEGQAVAEFFVANLLHSGEDGLVASRTNMTNTNKKAIEKHFEDLNEELEKKEDNKIAASFLNVKASPFLKEFQGTELLGSFSIDGEGVVPEELVLVEGGVLKTRLNGRTPSVGVERSNGYQRLQVGNSSVSKTIAPGVLLVNSEKTMSMDSLLQVFKKEAVEEELDFAVKVRNVELHASIKPIEHVRYSLSNGAEEPLQVSYVNYKQKNALKKIIAVSEDYYVYNFLYRGGSNVFGNLFGDGVPVSLVIPAAIVVKDFDIPSFKGNDEIYEPAIKGPYEQ